MPIQQILAVATKKAGSSLPTSVVFTSSPIVDYSSTLLKEVAMPAARPFLLCPCTEKQRWSKKWSPFLILNTAFEQKRQTLEHFFLPNIMRKSKLILITS